MSLGDKIAQDIISQFESGRVIDKVIDPAGEIHVKSIQRLSDRGKDASGTDLFPLDPVYAEGKSKSGGSGKADLYSADSSDHALDDIFDDPYSNDAFAIQFESGEQEDYMGAHQVGGQARGDFADMPVRKWFPTEGDMQSTPQKQNIEKIEELIEQYINEDRTIKVKARI